MKKAFTVFVLAVLMTSLIGTFVLAQEDGTVSDDESTGVFWIKVQKSFTFNEEKKADLSLKIADKKAIKAGKLAEAGKKKEFMKAVEEHKQAVEEAEKDFDKIATDGDVESVKHALKVTVMMQERLEIHKEKFVTVHNRILERQSDKMSEEKLSHVEEVFSKVEARTAEAEARIAQKQENLIARYKVLTGATDEEVKTLLDGFRAEFKEKSELRHKAIAETESSIEDRKAEIKEKIKIRGDSDKIRIKVESESDSDSGEGESDGDSENTETETKVKTEIKLN